MPELFPAVDVALAYFGASIGAGLFLGAVVALFNSWRA